MTSPKFVPAGGGDRANVLGMTHAYKVRGRDSDGTLLVLEIAVPPGCGAPLHRHEIDSECFYVLEGTLTVTTRDGVRRCSAGDFCHLPAGAEHAFRNDGPGIARALVTVTPGAAAERFFDALHDAGRNEPVAPTRVAELAARHDLAILDG